MALAVAGIVHRRAGDHAAGDALHPVQQGQCLGIAFAGRCAFQQRADSGVTQLGVPAVSDQGAELVMQRLSVGGGVCDQVRLGVQHGAGLGSFLGGHAVLGLQPGCELGCIPVIADHVVLAQVEQLGVVLHQASHRSGHVVIGRALGQVDAGLHVEHGGVEKIRQGALGRRHLQDGEDGIFPIGQRQSIGAQGQQHQQQKDEGFAHISLRNQKGEAAGLLPLRYRNVITRRAWDPCRRARSAFPDRPCRPHTDCCGSGSSLRR